LFILLSTGLCDFQYLAAEKDAQGHLASVIGKAAPVFENCEKDASGDSRMSAVESLFEKDNEIPSCVMSPAMVRIDRAMVTIF